MKELFLTEIDTNLDDAACRDAMAWLPADVQARALRYRCMKARKNLLASQRCLRGLLNRFSIPQSALRVCPQGRPFVQGGALEFNLSHSEERAVLAWSLDPDLREALGVDVEWIHRRVERDALAKRFFAPREHLYARLGAEEFFRVWTRKEAVLKTNGVGLRVPLSGFEVLEDTVSQEVTGRPLRLGTSLRDNGYLVSWAVPADWGEHRVVWLRYDHATGEVSPEGIDR
jgi:phosphopantetheinyl transferase